MLGAEESLLDLPPAFVVKIFVRAVRELRAGESTAVVTQGGLAEVDSSARVHRRQFDRGWKRFVLERWPAYKSA